MSTERKKILDKAKKLKELADRGVGGEKDNAIRMLSAYMEKHNITDNELTGHKLDDNTFRGYTKEQIYAMFAEELNMRGLFVAAKGYVNLMKNNDKLQQLKNKIADKQKTIRWDYDSKNFSYTGYVGSENLFDIQQTSDGALLYRAGKSKFEKEIEFKSIDDAKKYCEQIKSEVINDENGSSFFRR
jgi:hypothetical protein